MAYLFLDINEFTGSTKTKWAKAAKFLRENYGDHKIGKACYSWERDKNHFIGVNTGYWRDNPTDYSEESVRRILARYPDSAERIYYNCNTILLGEIDYGEPIESTSAL